MPEHDQHVCSTYCIHPEAVASAASSMLSPEEVNRLSDTFKVLGDPTRIRILFALSRQELCVCDLAAALNMTSSAISHQLRILRKSRLVKLRKQGKVVYYSLDDRHVVELFTQGLEHIRHQ